MNKYPYLHATPGRLRVKLPALKGDEVQCEALEQQIGEWAGINAASANPTTGNLLVIFDPAITGHDELLTTIEAAGYSAGTLVAAKRERGLMPDPLATVVASHIVQAAVQAAVERLISALI